MFNKMKSHFLLPFMLVLLSLQIQPALASESKLEFTATLTSVTQTEDENAEITVDAQGFDIPLLITGDTEISGPDDSADLSSFSAGDLVEIKGYFQDGGIAVQKLELLVVKPETFKLDGEVTAVSTAGDVTTLSILGIDVTTDASTTLKRRGPDRDDIVSPADILAGDRVEVKGAATLDDVVHADGTLLVSEIKVGMRSDGEIRLHGEVKSIDGDSLVVTMPGGGGSVTVVIDETTRLDDGMPVVGDEVKVEGWFNEALTVTAFQIEIKTDDDGDREQIRKEIRLTATGEEEIRGKLEIKAALENGESEQELELEIRKGAPSTTYSVVMFFGDATEYDFGTLTTDSSGEGELELEAESGGDDEGDLEALLPEGMTVVDITAVSVRLDGTPVLEGSL